MKPKPLVTKIIRNLLCGAAVAVSVSTAPAQNVIVSFDTNSIFAINATNDFNGDTISNELHTAVWHWWGGAATVHTYDPTQDADGNPASGSIKITATWPASGGDQYSVGLSLAGAEQYGIGINLPSLNYTNMEIDIKWDPSSTINITNHMTGGDPNGFGIGFVATQYGQSWAPNANQPVLVNDGQWHRYTIPIDSAWPSIPGVIFKKYKGDNAADANATSAFWVDNIKFNYNTNIVIPKPTLALAKATKGMSITAAQAGQQYQRQTIRSVPADAIDWVGNANPVTYSWTIGEFPSRSVAPGYFAVMFLAPGGGGSTDPDWNDANVIGVETSLNGANQGICTFRFKTNAPNSNGVLYGAGQLGVLTDPSGVLGTWSVTFSNNSIATLVGPSGASLTVDMGADAAALFDSPGSLPTYFGFQPGGPNNIGYRGTYTRIKVQDGATTVVDDTFPLAFSEMPDPSLWITRFSGGDIAGKVVDEDGYWVDWNKPDGLLSAVQNSGTVNTGWADAGLAVRNHGARGAVFAGTNVLNAFPGGTYFRLYSTNAP